MLITRKDNTEPIINSTGERVYELIGLGENLGNATKHSVGYVVIPAGCYSRPHLHPEDEETYCMLSGAGKIKIDNIEYALTAGDFILIHPPEKHQIFNAGDDDLEFIVVCAPAWTPTNSVFLDEEESR